jgi:hypothetical protein
MKQENFFNVRRAVSQSDGGIGCFFSGRLAGNGRLMRNPIAC